MGGRKEDENVMRRMDEICKVKKRSWRSGK
jgi:hypothetical protein